MTYRTPQALRMALERRLLETSAETGIGLDRLRRRVLFERIISRLQAAETGRWVLKGGMALEVRLRDDARVTKDIDLGLRDEVADSASLHERLVDALSADPDGDGFALAAGPPVPLGEDGGGHPTWRAKVTARLADKPFGTIQVDISPRTHELTVTERISLPNSLAFADIPAPEIEVIDIQRHAAEKLHGMLRGHGDRENTRVRDLVDLVILTEHGLLTPAAVAAAARDVWAERDDTEPPGSLPSLPGSWPGRYERLAADYGIATTTFPAAVASMARLWSTMFPTKET